MHADDHLLQVVNKDPFRSVQTMSTVQPEVTDHWENWDSNEGTTNSNGGMKTPAIMDPWRAASVRSGRSIAVSQDDEEEPLENTELIDVWKAEFQARHQTYPEHGTIGVCKPSEK